MKLPQSTRVCLRVPVFASENASLSFFGKNRKNWFKKCLYYINIESLRVKWNENFIKKLKNETASLKMPHPSIEKSILSHILWNRSSR